MPYLWSNIASTTAAVTNRFVASTNMKVGAYTLAQTTSPWGGGFTVTATITAVTGNDTAGTLTVVGTNLAGQAVTEVITLTAGSGGSGTQVFKSLTSVTGAGWVINTGNDTIVIGCAAGSYVLGSEGVLYGVVLNNSVAATVVISDARGTIATIPASAAAGTFYRYEAMVSGYLKVATTSTNDVTVLHSATVPTYATT